MLQKTIDCESLERMQFILVRLKVCSLQNATQLKRDSPTDPFWNMFQAALKIIF